ncbi:hypothetical protein KI387_038236, partial [Taxus chinensis]
IQVCMLKTLKKTKLLTKKMMKRWMMRKENTMKSMTNLLLKMKKQKIQIRMKMKNQKLNIVKRITLRITWNQQIVW